MFKKSFLCMLLALSLFGCAAGGQIYSKDEETAIMHTMQGKAAPKLYLYAPSFFKFSRHQGDPFVCTLDGNPVGGIRLGEYVVMPAKGGDHTLACEQNVSGVGLVTTKTRGSLAIKIEKDDLYAMVKNGLTTFAPLKLESGKTPPDKFNEDYQLSKTCTACLGK